MSDLDRNVLGLGERPALLLVDMINGFTHDDCPLGTECPEVIDANQQLLQSFREKGLPVYFTTVIHREDHGAHVFRARINDLEVLTHDSHWVEIDERVAMIEGEILIEKQWASAFFKTDLDQQLHDAGVDSLVVTGLTTSGCVRATVVDGLQHNFRVVVPREAVGDRNADAHEANLFDMHAKYADVEPLATVLQYIQAVKS